GIFAGRLVLTGQHLHRIANALWMDGRRRDRLDVRSRLDRSCGVSVLRLLKRRSDIRGVHGKSRRCLQLQRGSPDPYWHYRHIVPVQLRAWWVQILRNRQVSASAFTLEPKTNGPEASGLSAVATGSGASSGVSP